MPDRLVRDLCAVLELQCGQPWLALGDDLDAAVRDRAALAEIDDLERRAAERESFDAMVADLQQPGQADLLQLLEVEAALEGVVGDFVAARQFEGSQTDKIGNGERQLDVPDGECFLLKVDTGDAGIRNLSRKREIINSAKGI